MDDLVGAYTPDTYDGRVVVVACDETEYSWDGSASQQNGVFTYHYVGHSESGLYTYNTVEDAFTYAAPLVKKDVWDMYREDMNPKIYDHYTGDWTF